jgi:hypothetical protein
MVRKTRWDAAELCNEDILHLNIDILILQPLAAVATEFPALLPTVLPHRHPVELHGNRSCSS